MAKAYTDLEQSKKLAKFLPLDSADMYWSRCAITDFGDGELKVSYAVEPCNVSQTKNTKEDIPCWSLTALLNVLPKPTKRIYELNIYGGDEKPFFGFNDCDMNIHKGFEGDDYVDACVNMIIYIHEKLNNF